MHFQRLPSLSDKESARLSSGEAGLAMSIISPCSPGNTSKSMSRHSRLTLILRHELTKSRTEGNSSQEIISTTQRGEIQYVTIVFFFRNIYFLFFHF